MSTASQAEEPITVSRRLLVILLEETPRISTIRNMTEEDRLSTVRLYNATTWPDDATVPCSLFQYSTTSALCQEIIDTIDDPYEFGVFEGAHLPPWKVAMANPPE